MEVEEDERVNGGKETNRERLIKKESEHIIDISFIRSEITSDNIRKSKN